jgi:hypothetical protein
LYQVFLYKCKRVKFPATGTDGKVVGGRIAATER